jgi:HEAT repeat protein
MSAPAQNPISSDDLPPVQPPSAGFLVQLFLIPGIIVAIIVVVWMLFVWLATPDSDPQKYVEGIGRNTDDAWQKAEYLAEMLRNDRGNQLKGDAQLAGKLAELLNESIDAGLMDDRSINLRVYLSSALGQFNTPEGLPALLKAASTSREPSELPVRRSALDAIGMLVANLQSAGDQTAELPDREKLFSTLFDASRDHEPVIRLRAAYVLGIVGDKRATSPLVKMLDDPYPDVSYNAATALARRGDPRAIDTLLEMLDPKQSKAIEKEDPAMQAEKRSIILVNGLRAIGQLADADPSADLSRVEPAVDRLRDSSLPLEVRDAAMAAHEKLQKRQQPAAR